MLAILRGMAANLAPKYRAQLSQHLFQVFNYQTNLDLKAQPLEFTLGSSGKDFQQLKHNPQPLEHIGNIEEPAAILTVGLQRDLLMLEKWLLELEPLIVVGPEGCGKSLLIRTAIAHLAKTQQKVGLATIHCNAQTTASHVIQKLQQMCIKGSCAQGNILKPKDSSRLILYLKDINLPKPDKYQTIQLIAFLQQLITHKGYYDDNLEFVYLEDKIQIIASMAPSSTMGRHSLSSRFTANVRILSIDYPTPTELQLIYQQYLDLILGSTKHQVTGQKVSGYLVDFYQQVKQSFTVDEQRHYQFTPRDLTRMVFKLKQHSFDHKDPKAFYEILFWESCRIFMDRIVSLQSRATFSNLIKNLMNRHFNYDTTAQGSFVFTTLSSAHKLQKLNYKDFNQVFNKGYMTYEREVKEVNFRFLQEHKDLIVSIDNTLHNQQSLLIAGRSGMGRKVCVQLISYLNNFTFLSPQVAKDYGIREFRKELKGFLEQVGGQDQQSVLFLEDYQLISSEFLEQINSLISAGEVPGLVSQEEMEGWLGPQAEDLRRDNWGKTLYEAFCIRVKSNLRVILSLDYANQQFTQQCASNPSFYNCCNILWQVDLKTESMQELCRMELQPDRTEVEQKVINSKTDGYDKDKIIQEMPAMHKLAVDKLGVKVAPRQYYSLINTFKKIYDSKVGSQGAQTTHLSMGLNKLKEAEAQVDQLSKEAAQQSQELNLKQSEADQALKQITKAMENAAQRKQETQIMQASLQQEEQLIQESKGKIEEELSGIMPQVELAQKAVGSISKTNINELRSFMMPVDTIHDILSAVVKIFGNQDTSWNSMKKFIAQKGVIEQIVNFDSRTLSRDVRQNLQAFINTKKNSFERQTAYRASQAAGPLAEWVVAILKLSVVLESIAPLENQQKKIQNNLVVSKNKCEENMRQLQLLDQQVQELKDNFQKRTGEAATLKKELENTEQTLKNANTLLQKLSGEKMRWQNQLKEYQDEKQQLPTNSLLAAAFTVYLAQEDEDMRHSLMTAYRNQLQCTHFHYLRFMASENTILRLKAEGLPGDNLSLENSAALFQCYQTSLIVDPNYQATQWLAKHLPSAEEVIQLEKKYSTSLELGIRFGKTIIVKETNCIDPLLVPILRKDLVQQGPRAVIVVGDKTVDYSPEFQLFICTRNTSIQLPSYHKGLVNIINFTVTKSGLENKLLSIVIDHEQPELEQKKSKLVQQEENLKIQLSDLEKSLLEKLAESKGNILENTELIESLEQTKDKSIQIGKSLAESSQLQLSLDQQRDVYRPLASQGAQLFLLLSDTKKINNMYRFSQEQFVNLFKKSLEIEYSLEDSKKKMEFAQSNLYRNTINSIGGALFKQDRLTLGLHILQGLRPNLFEKHEWEYFLNLVVGQKIHDKVPGWIPVDRQEAYQYLLGTFSVFRGMQWSELELLIKHATPEKAFPNVFKQKLSEFQRLLIIQTLRPDRLAIALQSFVCDNLNLQSILGLTFSFDSIFQHQSNNQNPILFIVSAGSDPSKELEEFGSQMVGKDKIKELSMGGGQDELALEMLREAALKGEWLIFKNLHLVTHWLPILEKELRVLQPHKDFRFWLTTEPHLHFPSILLESCIKVSYEAPPGLKKNLSRLQNQTGNTNEQSEKLTLQLALSWLHALLQERRTYIPQGWSKFYEFSYSDLRSAQVLLEEQFRMYKTATRFQWQTIVGLFQDAVYGGRIDNEFDLAVLNTYLHQLFNRNTVEGGLQLTPSLSLPKINSHKDIQSFINKLSDNDSPVLFGLPSNIEKAVQRYQIQQVLNSLKVMLRVSSQDLHFDKDKWSSQLSPLFTLWQQSQKTLQDSLPVSTLEDQPDSLLSFIDSEIKGARHTYQTIVDTMTGLTKVCQGQGLLTPLIFTQGSQILKGEVPHQWTIFWQGPDNPNTWLLHFTKKASCLKQWLTLTQQNNILKSPVNLNQLYHSEIFLNCLRQMTARSLQQSVDNLKLEASFDPQHLSSNMLLSVQGLYLQGSGFNQNVLCSPQDNQSEYLQLPICYLAWVPIRSLELKPQQELVQVPIFHSGNRETILCKVNLPVQNKSQRILAGTALFLNNQE